MSPQLGPSAVDRFRNVVARRLGLQFDETKLGFLAEVLGRRLELCRQPLTQYLHALEHQPSRSEVQALARELTVAETYFFRHHAQLRAFAEVALPDRGAARAPDQPIRILSAGCASGEESYSLAMVVRESAVVPPGAVAIVGVDVNPAVLERGRRGTFSSWALREAPPEVRTRWFRQVGRDFELDSEIRGAVTLQEGNLAEDDAALWQDAAYDVVFCRNVLMYLTAEVVESVVGRVTRALAPGGYLFLGHAETLRGLSHDFHLRHTHDAFYYQRKDCLEVTTAARTGVRAAGPAAPLEDAVEAATTWVDAIRLASERIERLTQTQQRTALPDDAAAGRTRWDLGVALELLKNERFADALELIRRLPAEAARDPDVLLLHAVLLTHGGHLPGAEEMCGRLLVVDELNAGAHYLLALCREGAGDRSGAAEHDQIATYLDPGFAMSHLHLGLLARRAHQQDVARRELGRALVLLRQEDPARLLLFGGGFGRDALLALCRAELIACGGTP